MGVPTADFITRAGQQGIPYFQKTREELRREIDHAKSH